MNRMLDYQGYEQNAGLPGARSECWTTRGTKAQRAALTLYPRDECLSVGPHDREESQVKVWVTMTKRRARLGSKVRGEEGLRAV